MNPNDTRERAQPWLDAEFVAFEGASVTDAPEHVDGDSVAHHVELTADHYEEPITAEVPVGLYGDVALPQEGDRVLAGYRRNGRAVVLGVRYQSPDDIPPYEAGERIVGHPTTASRVHLENDGTLTVHADSGSQVTIDPEGRVLVDGTNGNSVDLKTDGSVAVTGTAGNTVELPTSGDVVLNGGTTKPVTDVTTTTDSDGHVTSISLVRSDTVLVPQ